MTHAKPREIGNDAARVSEGEFAIELQPVGSARNIHSS
jgi:hypothetical protein